MRSSRPSAASTNGAGSTMGVAGEISISSARSISGSWPSVQSSERSGRTTMPMRARLARTRAKMRPPSGPPQ